jgi:hypothetical protein
MALLQLLAARLARIDALAFHTGEHAGAEHLLAAVRLLDQLTHDKAGPISLKRIVGDIHAHNFRWGVSDGNENPIADIPGRRIGCSTHQIARAGAAHRRTF